MEPSHSMLLPYLLITWVVITVILAILVIYRITLGSKESNRIDINATEQQQLKDQQILVSKMARLRGPIVALLVISSALLLTSAGIWIYQGLLRS